MITPTLPPGGFEGADRSNHHHLHHQQEQRQQLHQQRHNQHNVDTLLVTPSRRSRELYKYFYPPSFERQLPTFNTNLLSSQAQLVALTLQCRCLINLLDASQQYRVAEATPSFVDDGDAQLEDLTESLWAQCRLDDTENSVCQYTIDALDSPDGTPAFFEVVDMPNDPRFSQRPYVSGAPFFKYYFGLPLRTKSGIAIGALAIIDSNWRDPTTQNQRSFLKGIADNVMAYLELERDSQERLRATEMNKSLNRFVDHSPSRDTRCSVTSISASQQHRQGSTELSPSALPASSAPGDASNSNPDTKVPNHKGENAHSHSSGLGISKSNGSPNLKSSLDENDRPEGTVYGDPFKRAAELLRQSLVLGQDGGIVFLDTAPATVPSPIDRRDSTFRKINQAMGTVAVRNNPLQTSNISLHEGLHGECRVVASSISTENPPTPGKRPTMGLHFPNAFIPMSVEDLTSLIGQYPLGKLWIFDEKDSGGTSQETEIPVEEQWVGVKQLSQSFPGATSLFMFPIWDPRSTRWTALFAYSSSRFRTFTPEIDIPHMISFCNCITLELIRLATAAADKQKSDFIGSISHELRSPLHGILASCELLQDTGLSDFQQSFVDTANSCGRTLLDTITMVLDFNKINSLDRERQTTRPIPRTSNSSQPTAVGDQSASLEKSPIKLPGLSGVVDLAAIVEEVVEGAAISHAFQGLQHVDVSDVGAHARGRTKRTNANSRGRSRLRNPVEIVLEVSHAAESSWLYVTQPGAFRRIVMNLVGNAMKYTTKGWIRVSLKVEKSINPKYQWSQDNSSPHDVIQFSVVDTGKGMSSEFLDGRVFMPFAQEDSLSAGTGLGLSMVKNLLHMLDGDINIESAVDRGTSVTVSLPMQRKTGTHKDYLASSGLSPPSVSTNSSLGETSIDLVRRNAHGWQVAFLSQDSVSQKAVEAEISKITELCLREYISGWFDMAMLTSANFHESADIIITNDFDLQTLLTDLTKSPRPRQRQPCVVVLCSDRTRHATLMEHEGCGLFMELISKPFGPYKFAKAIQSCLDRLESYDGTIASAGRVEIPRRLSDEITPKPIVVSDPGLQADYKMTLNGVVLGKSSSSNAAMAMETPSQTSSSASIASPMDEFPFPTADHRNISSPNSQGVTPTAGQFTDKLDLKKLDLKIIDRPVPVLLPTPLLESPRPTEIPQLQKPPRILLVDDNLINLKILEAFMKKLKYSRISSACDGAEASDIYHSALDANDPYDVVFLDLNMPNVDGFEAARRIRAHEKEYINGIASAALKPAPSMIIALTGLSSEEDQLMAFDAGVDLYITKPASFKEVSKLMKNWEANGGAAASELLPHGEVTENSVCVA